MRIAFLPFYSQQNKRTGKFLLESDSGVKLYSYMANAALREGWTPAFFVPRPSLCEGQLDVPTSRQEMLPYDLAVSNLDRRLQWDPAFLRHLGTFDVVLTQHEFLAYPFRCLCPDACIVMECGIKPTTAWPQTEALFPLAQRAADAVHCNSRVLAGTVDARRVFVWPFAVHESLCMTPHTAYRSRRYDVVFPARCSSTNYSHHREFCCAMNGSNLNILMTDPTSYLRSGAEGVCAWLWDKPATPREYVEALRNSRVVVGLTDNGYGGYAFLEAIALGCVPVALYVPEYIELLGRDWPYYLESMDPRHMNAAISAAVERGWDGAEYPEEAVHSRMYSRVWRRAKSDLEELHDRRSGRS